MTLSRLNRLLLTAPFLVVSVQAQATIGIFEHGNGIKSMGMGGIAYVIGEEATSLSANPAHAIGMGTRYDIGVHGFAPMADVDVAGNAAAPDSRHRNSGRRYFAIPQGGFNRVLGARWAVGMTAFAAGLGPDYKRNPYARFGGDARGSLFLNSAGVSAVLAYKAGQDQALGASLNLVYQTLNVEGVGFFGALSRTPGKVSNQGKDDALGVGVSLGWRGQLTPTVSAALSYRSKTWTEKHDDYRGLLPDQGQLELPQIWGGGMAYAPHPAWTVAADFQRYQYTGQDAFGSRLRQLDPANGVLLGDDQAPGFGFRNQNVYKLGVAWKASPQWTLRAGYLDATQLMSPTETLFGMFGPAPGTVHYTLGGTWTNRQWEVSGFTSWAPRERVRGSRSIPPDFGGGEANVAYETVSVGISLGRAFGR